MAPCASSLALYINILAWLTRRVPYVSHRVCPHFMALLHLPPPSSSALQGGVTRLTTEPWLWAGPRQPSTFTQLGRGDEEKTVPVQQPKMV